MRSRLTTYSLLLLLLLTCIPCRAQVAAPVDTVHLWSDEDVLHGSRAVLYPYLADNSDGVGVIVCPGGSYFWLDEEGEGHGVARWLQSNGINAFVLLYRAAGFGAYFWAYRLVLRGNRHPDMITDAQRALQWVREHADAYGVDPDKVGMMGFSAGGHLVMSAACFSGTSFLADAGVECSASLRPAFVAPIYPVVTMEGDLAHKRSRRALLGDNRQCSKEMRDSLSLEKHIPADCPPVFVVNCKDDPVVDYRNSVLLDSALTVAGVPHKYIQYEEGKHGFGASDYYGTPESRQWKNEFLNWLSKTLNNEQQ